MQHNPLGRSSSSSSSAHTHAHHVPPGSGYGGGSPFSTGVFATNGSSESLRSSGGLHPPTSSDNPGLALWLQTNLEPDHPGELGVWEWVRSFAWRNRILGLLLMYIYTSNVLEFGRSIT